MPSRFGSKEHTDSTIDPVLESILVWAMYSWHGGSQLVVHANHAGPRTLTLPTFSMFIPIVRPLLILVIWNLHQILFKSFYVDARTVTFQDEKLSISMTKVTSQCLITLYNFKILNVWEVQIRLQEHLGVNHKTPTNVVACESSQNPHLPIVVLLLVGNDANANSLWCHPTECVANQHCLLGRNVGGRVEQPSIEGWPIALTPPNWGHIAHSGVKKLSPFQCRLC